MEEIENCSYAMVVGGNCTCVGGQMMDLHCWVDGGAGGGGDSCAVKLVAEAISGGD